MPPEASGALVLAGGDVPARAALDAAWPGWDAGISMVIAADGGARHASGLGLRIDRWVGDADSTNPDELAALVDGGAQVDLVPAAKDATDTELAVLAAIGEGAQDIVLLGALGGPRVDHGLANLGLLRHPALGPRSLVLFDLGPARISLLSAIDSPATRELAGRVGDIVSLLPVGDTAQGVTTRDLQYPLADEPLVLGQTRGISNVRTARVAAVTLRAGRLLVIETPVTVGS